MIELLWNLSQEGDLREARSRIQSVKSDQLAHQDELRKLRGRRSSRSDL